MKPTHLIALAVALVGCAAAYGIHLYGKPETSRSLASASVKPNMAAIKRHRPALTATADSMNSISTHTATRGEISSREASARTIGGSPEGNHGLLSEAQWRENATKVAMEANHELDRMVGLLDLDAVQQDKMFSTLAQQSPHWLPGMQTGDNLKHSDSAVVHDKSPVSSTAATVAKSPAASAVKPPSATVAKPPATTVATTPAATPPVTDVTAILTSDQEQTLVREEMDRQAWWAEVLPQLLAPTMAGTTTITAVPNSDPPPDTKTFDGGDVLIEE